MTGSELKKIAKDSGLTIDEIVEKSGIKPRTYSSLYSKSYIEKHYLDKLGFLLQDSANKNTVKDSEVPRPSAKLQAEMMELIMKSLAAAQDDLRVYRKIVEIVVDSGAMKVENVQKLKEQLK